MAWGPAKVILPRKQRRLDRLDLLPHRLLLISGIRPSRLAAREQLPAGTFRLRSADGYLQQRQTLSL